MAAQQAAQVAQNIAENVKASVQGFVAPLKQGSKLPAGVLLKEKSPTEANIDLGALSGKSKHVTNMAKDDNVHLT